MQGSTAAIFGVHVGLSIDCRTEVRDCCIFSLNIFLLPAGVQIGSEALDRQGGN